jgi:ubiquinone/menaquinone biosynthesis C-methylase UbiE
MKKRYIWTSEGLERRGRYLWRDELVSMLYRHLGVKSGITAVDVGCGSGFLTRLIAKGLKGRGRVIGVDIDEKLLHAAQEIANREGFHSLIEFKKANAYRLPFPDNFADVAACHTLLYILGKPLKALREMVRVAKRDGKVVAIEPDYRGRVIYDPLDKAYNELAYRFNDAVIGVFRKIYGADLSIGSKLPLMFLKAELTEIETYGYLLPTSPLMWDKRYSVEELVDCYKKSLFELTSWSEEEKKAMKEYGMSEKEFNEYQRKTVKKIKNFIKNPKKMRTYASISCAPSSWSSGRNNDILLDTFTSPYAPKSFGCVSTISKLSLKAPSY